MCWRLILIAFPSYSVPYMLGLSVSLIQELAIWLVWPIALGLASLCLQCAGIVGRLLCMPRVDMGSADLKFSPYTCVANVLSTETSPTGLG